MKNLSMKELKLEQEWYSEETFMKAVYVSAINRLNEHDTKRVRQLIQSTEKHLKEQDV